MATPTTRKDTGKQAHLATDPAGPTGRLAVWVAQTTLHDIPASVRDRARHLVLDGIACAVVGAQLPVSRAGVEGVTALDSARGCGADRLGRLNHQFDVGCHAQRQFLPGVRAG
jgi:MmgE/PrpD N-terminal domain